MRCSSWPAWLKQAVGDPAALILDEPTNGLDPQGIAWLRNLPQDYARQGRTVLFSSHALPEVEQLAERVVIVNRGRLARTGQLAELTAGQGGLEQVFLALTAACAVPGQEGGR
jgi:ABC-2 type transport system ATP-binding protein